MHRRSSFPIAVAAVAFAALGAVAGGNAPGVSAREADPADDTCEVSEGYVLPSGPEAFGVVADRAGAGPFVMLNLYRLRDFADYSGWPELEPASPISGAEAFEQLAATLDAELAGVGAEVIFRAEGGASFIGPSCERWDVVQLIRYPSYEAFVDFASLATVINSIPHRFAVLEDSRVVPLAPEECDGSPFGAPPPHAKGTPHRNWGKRGPRGRSGQGHPVGSPICR